MWWAKVKEEEIDLSAYRDYHDAYQRIGRFLDDVYMHNQPNPTSRDREDDLSRRYFEDLVDGERLDCRPVEMTCEEIVSFAQRYDPQPFHVDIDRARESAFGGLIASSLHTLSACTRVVVEAQGDLEIISGVGIGEVSMYNPVRPGDRLDVEAWWTDLRRSKRRKDRGYATIACKVANQRGELVMAYSYRYLVACRSTG